MADQTIDNLKLPNDVKEIYNNIQLLYRALLLQPTDGGNSLGNRLKRRIIMYCNRLRTKLQNNRISIDEYNMSIDQLQDLIGRYILDNNFNPNNSYNVYNIIRNLNKMEIGDEIALSFTGLLEYLKHDIRRLQNRMQGLVNYYEGQIGGLEWFYNITIGWFGWIVNWCTHSTMAEKYKYFMEHLCEDFISDVNICINEIQQFDDIPDKLKYQIEVDNYDDGVMHVIINGIESISIG